jgi:hypothetical protein
VGDLPKVAGKRSAAVQAKIPIVVKEGYHVNSNKPNEEYLIPLKLTWTSLGALEGGTVTYPKPALEKYEFSEQPLSVYTGGFDLLWRTSRWRRMPLPVRERLPGSCVIRHAATGPVIRRKQWISPCPIRCSEPHTDEISTEEHFPIRAHPYRC